MTLKDKTLEKNQIPLSNLKKNNNYLISNVQCSHFWSHKYLSLVNLFEPRSKQGPPLYLVDMAISPLLFYKSPHQSVFLPFCFVGETRLFFLCSFSLSGFCQWHPCGVFHHVLLPLHFLNWHLDVKPHALDF